MSNADKYLENKQKTTQFIKNKAFDIISIGIIAAMTILSLGVIELREITWLEIGNLIVESVPFYLAATMLTLNYYTKGTFAGKLTDTFNEAVNYYSSYVTNLTGEQLKLLPLFCKEYNDKTLKNIQEGILYSVALTWGEYDEGDVENPPIKAMSKEDLISKYGKEITSVIDKCKKVKIHGLHPNVILGDLNNPDNTNLGNNEEELKRKRTTNYVTTYVFSIFFMSLIAVKDIVQWGWIGAAVTLFKVLYITCGAYMKYFDGYEDITVNVVNHLYRKTDILKEYVCWYEEQKVKTVPINKDLIE